MCDATVINNLNNLIGTNTDIGKDFNVKILHGLKVVKLLGVGGFGKVYQVEKINAPGQYLALKIIDLSNKYNQQKFLKEKGVLKKFTKYSLFKKNGECKHDNINCYLDLDGTDTCGFILTNYFNTDLEKDLQVNKGFRVRMLKNLNFVSQYIKWIKNLASAITYIHSKLLAHGDLKPANILVNTVKNFLAITDFDTLCVINKTNEFCKVTDITSLYASPELFAIMDDKKKRMQVPIEIIQISDYWALCVIMLELWLGTDELMELLKAHLPTPFFAQDFYDYINKNKDFYQNLMLSVTKLVNTTVTKNNKPYIIFILGLLLQAIILMEKIGTKKVQKGDLYLFLKQISKLNPDIAQIAPVVSMAGGGIDYEHKYLKYRNKYLELKARMATV